MNKSSSSLPRIAALVPMRHSSERVPGKNYRNLAGKPLFHHIIGALLACPEITQVVVDTDSPVVMQGLREHFPDVVVLERPEHLRDGMIPMNDILLHDTSQVSADYYLQTHSTNPLLKSETISKSIQAFLANLDTYDSLFSVTRLQTRTSLGSHPAQPCCQSSLGCVVCHKSGFLLLLSSAHWPPWQLFGGSVRRRSGCDRGVSSSQGS